MRRALVVLLLLAASSAAARDAQVIYSRYKSGRPRLVVVARYVAFDEGEVQLLRFPDRAGAKGTIVDRYDPDAGATGVSLLPLIDPKDVVVETASKHPAEGRILRVRKDKLVEIGEEYAGARNTPAESGCSSPDFFMAPAYATVILPVRPIVMSHPPGIRSTQLYS